MQSGDAAAATLRGVILALSLTAALLTTGAFVPQTLRTWRTRSADDLAWGYLGLFGLGVGLWLMYGLVQGDPALIAANGLTLVMVCAIATAKATSHRAN
jgi:MtN3 and saliva related transmembrane protein